MVFCDCSDAIRRQHITIGIRHKLCNALARCFRSSLQTSPSRSRSNSVLWSDWHSKLKSSATAIRSHSAKDHRTRDRIDTQAFCSTFSSSVPRRRSEFQRTQSPSPQRGNYCLPKESFSAESTQLIPRMRRRICDCCGVSRTQQNPFFCRQRIVARFA